MPKEPRSTPPANGMDLGIPILTAIVLTVAGLGLWFQFGREPTPNTIRVSPPPVTTPGGSEIVYTNGQHPQGLTAAMPKIEPRDGYVGSDVCLECHAQNHESWFNSYHRTMTQKATADVVMADFDNVQVRIGPKPEVYNLSVSQGLCFVEMGEQHKLPFSRPNARMRFPIAMTTGSHHMQVYWFPLQDGALGMLPIAYLKADRRWVPRSSTFLTPHTDLLGVEPARWNIGCVHCHTTHGDTGLSQRNGVPEYNTRSAELGISCEACHGPAAKHVALRRKKDVAPVDDPIVNPAKLSPALSAQTCGGCHSFSLPHSENITHPAGEPLTASHAIRRYDEATKDYLRRQYENLGLSDGELEDALSADFEGSFWPDGMVRIAGREYNGMLDTKCHTAGELSCVSCHQLHKPRKDPRSYKAWADDQLHSGFRTDKACTQCHDPAAYSATTHTHHAAASSGSRCYNCHMPHTTYGVLKAMRSHTITSPTVLESTKYGRPNACNLCHLDQTLDWTAHHLAERYGQAVPRLSDDQKTISAALSWALEGDAAQRALIAWSMGWQPAQEASSADWLTPYLAFLMTDSYDAVRYIAHRSLKSLGVSDADYDFIAAPDLRSRSVNQIRTLWLRQPHKKIPPTVLINPDLKIQHQEIDRLLARRNQRRIRMHE
jgi:hypothetical protein